MVHCNVLVKIMNFFIIALFVVAVNCVSRRIISNTKIQREFNKFTSVYKKKYEFNERKYRLSVFADNFRRISEHNKLYKPGRVTFTVGVNQLADRTNRELTEMRKCLSTGSKRLTYSDYYKPPKNIHVPNNWDWRERGAVTEVKDQHHFATPEKPYCGSCYAFTAIGAIEGQYAIKYGRKRALSEQNIVDCGKNLTYDLNGCHGGEAYDVYRYVRDYGVQAQNTYPYTGREETCRYDPLKVVARVKSYKMLRQSEDHLKKAIYQIGPISVGMACSGIMNFYTGGVYYDPNCSNDIKSLNHGLVAVGYGSLDGNDYWIVKNSWGPDWGLEGYFLHARNKENNCGIASAATYPIL